MHFQNFDTLVVDDDKNARNRLREVLRTLVWSGKSHLANNYPDTLVKLAGINKLDAVFISSSMPADSFRKLVQAVTQKVIKSPPIFVGVLRPDHQDASKISEYVLAGSQGFICEPFSADVLSDLLSTTISAKHEASTAGTKERGSLQLLIKEFSIQLDSRFFRIIRGLGPAGYPLRALKKLHDEIKPIAEKNFAQYVDTVNDIMNQAAPSGRVIREDARKAPAQPKVEEIPLHPCYHVEMHMKKNSVSRERLLSSLKIPQEEVMLFLEGKSSVTEPLSREIARVVGKTSAHWLDLQEKYDLYQKAQAAAKG